MSGHSKWKTIQHKKGAADAKRGKIFSRISKELMLAAKSGGGNPDSNASLRTILQKARAANMPMDNIERAVKKGTGEIAGATLEELGYECFGAGGVGIVVKALTDNKNRAAAEIRHIFTRHGLSFAGPGSVSRGFKRKGQILVSAADVAEEKLMGIVLDAGAEDLQQDGDEFEILTDPSAFAAVVEALEKAQIKTSGAEIRMVPDTYVPVKDKAVAKSVMKFIDDLEDNDDVQDVFTNMDVDDSILAQLEKEG